MQITITPRFSEADVMGHISNTAMPVWFEQARIAIFKLFSKQDNMADLSLILRRQEIEYLAQTYLGQDVTIATHIEKVGNSSLTIAHQAIQNSVVVATGVCVMVHFDYHLHASLPIPERLRQALAQL